jgi:hypothetical protein
VGLGGVHHTLDQESTCNKTKASNESFPKVGIPILKCGQACPPNQVHYEFMKYI